MAVFFLRIVVLTATLASLTEAFVSPTHEARPAATRQTTELGVLSVSAAEMETARSAVRILTVYLYMLNIPSMF
jgi:hypothetical protein